MNFIAMQHAKEDQIVRAALLALQRDRQAWDPNSTAEMQPSPCEQSQLRPWHLKGPTVSFF